MVFSECDALSDLLDNIYIRLMKGEILHSKPKCKITVIINRQTTIKKTAKSNACFLKSKGERTHPQFTFVMCILDASTIFIYWLFTSKIKTRQNKLVSKDIR